MVPAWSTTNVIPIITDIASSTAIMQQNACTSKLCDTRLSLPMTLSLLAVGCYPASAPRVDGSFYGARVGIVLDRPQSAFRTHSLQLDIGVVSCSICYGVCLVC